MRGHVPGTAENPVLPGLDTVVMEMKPGHSLQERSLGQDRAMS